jgi:hypothetical protein
MMIRDSKLQVRRAVAVFACGASLAGAATASAAPAGTKAHSCGARSITLPHKPSETVKVAISRIRVEGGVTCAVAIKVIRGAVLHQIPGEWKVSHGNFKVPHGLVAQQAVNGHKRITWAQTA